MGDDHGAEVGGIEAGLLPVAAAQVRETLEEPAVDQDAGVVALDEELAAGDRAYRTEQPQECRSGRGGSGARGCLGHDPPSLR